MSRFFYRRPVLAELLLSGYRSVVQDLITTHLDLLSSLGFIQNTKLFPISIKLFSTCEAQVRRKNLKECSFTVSYLINSCGLSPKSAKSVAKRVKLKSSKKPDSVLQFFKNHGFSDTQIAKLVRLYPSLLFSVPERSVLPKIEFLKSIGLTSAELADVCSSIPAILGQSFENVLIPNYKLLKSLFLSDENVTKVFRKRKRLFSFDLQKTVSPKLAVFKELGMPEAYNPLILSCYAPVVLQRQDKFVENVKKVTELGFDPQKWEFIQAMQVFASLSQPSMERKLDVFRKWGWSSEDITLAFRKCPAYICTSENKIDRVLDFLINKMGWQPSAVFHVPYVFRYNLEKRIIPRCSVIRVLLLKGLINKEKQFCISYLVISSNKCFLESFVTKYEDQVPQLLPIFHGKMRIEELGFEFEQKSVTEQRSM